MAAAASRECVVRREPYTVCEVLGGLSKFDGNPITVRGQIGSGGQGAYLVADCPVGSDSAECAWPNTIWLAFPRPSAAERRASMASYRRFLSAVKRVRQGKRDRIIGTITGRLKAGAVCRPAPPGSKAGPVRLGYGPDGEGPAELTIWQIGDVVVEKK
jgi:hypothetical protein